MTETPELVKRLERDAKLLDEDGWGDAANRTREAATRIASLTARVEELRSELATERSADPELEWDGTGQIFDPRCHCEKCAIGRAEQRERNAARATRSAGKAE